MAAGKSTRMGQAKQLLRLGEENGAGPDHRERPPLAVDEIVLVLGASAEAIRQQLPLSLLEGLKVVVNPAYEQGMASSLRAGLSALDPHSDAALIVLGDQPFVRPRPSIKLSMSYRRTQAQIVIPSYQGDRGNPVLLDRSVFAEVMALEGDIGCRAIFGNHAEAM